MENNLRSKISATLNKLSKIGFDEMIERNRALSIYSTEELKNKILEKFTAIQNDKILRESYVFALNLNDAVNEKELQAQLFHEVHESLEECFVKCNKPIEAISFQYNYKPHFSCICWSEGEYEIYEIEKHLKRGNVIHCVEGAVNFEKWIRPIQIFEENESFMDLYMDGYVQLRKLYYWNIYANIIDAIKVFNEKYMVTFSQKLTNIYYYANEFDCESTFLIKT